jgi:transcriptional regulator with XRE-family HTH domain
MNQARAADVAAIPASYLSDVERGHRTPSLDWLRDYADALGVPRSSLSPDLADRPQSPLDPSRLPPVPALSKKKRRGC